MSLFLWYIKNREKVTSRFFKNEIFVAIVSLDDYEAARRIMLGFSDFVANRHTRNHEFRLIVAYGSRDNLRQQLTQAFVDPYSMILSVGAETTLLAKSISAELASDKPVGFIDIRDPQRLGIIRSYAEPDSNFFGFVDSADHIEDHVYRLLQMIPRLENVFLLYDPLQEKGYSELEKNKFSAAFKNKSVEVVTVPITSQEIAASSTEERVRTLAKKYKYNAIVTLRDPLVMSSMQVLSDIAERYQVPIYSADPESVLRFASIGSGYNAYDMGGKTAERSLPYIKQVERPLFVPTTFHTMDYKSYANRLIMIRQGLEITNENRDWFKYQVTFTPF